MIQRTRGDDMDPSFLTDNEINAKLRQYVDAKITVNERSPISDQCIRNIKKGIDIGLKYRKLLNKVDIIYNEKYTFSLFIYELRTKSKLTVAEMSKILEIDVDTIDMLESGRKKINTFSLGFIAKVLCKIKISLSKYKNLLENELISSSQPSIQSTFARSRSTLNDDDRTKKLSHGIDAIRMEIAKRNKTSQPSQVDENHIKGIRRKLLEAKAYTLLDY